MQLAAASAVAFRCLPTAVSHRAGSLKCLMSQFCRGAAGGQEEPAVIHEVDWSVNNNNYISLIGNLTGVRLKNSKPRGRSLLYQRPLNGGSPQTLGAF